MIRKPQLNPNLKTKIIERFGTQADFAYHLGIHESLISAIVRGRRNLNEVERVRWARELECRPEDLFPTGIQMQHYNMESNAQTETRENVEVGR